MARFKLLGNEIQGRDANQAPLSLDQQRPKSVTVVYETDDSQEVQMILESGGFFRDRDNFISVTSVIDSANPVASDPVSAFPQKGN
jgi:hypothetical protein